MNAKLCKSLRRVAAGLSETPVTDKKYRNHPTQKGFDGFVTTHTQILEPGCGRAAYHRLKKEFRK